jgi:hypothetical protein
MIIEIYEPVHLNIPLGFFFVVSVFLISKFGKDDNTDYFKNSDKKLDLILNYLYGNNHRKNINN